MIGTYPFNNSTPQLKPRIKMKSNTHNPSTQDKETNEPFTISVFHTCMKLLCPQMTNRCLSNIAGSQRHGLAWRHAANSSLWPSSVVHIRRPVIKPFHFTAQAWDKKSKIRIPLSLWLWNLVWYMTPLTQPLSRYVRYYLSEKRRNDNDQGFSRIWVD